MLKNAMLIFTLLTASAAFAADGSVTINGCTSTGVENCLFIDTPQGKYALFVKPPRPDPGRGISVTGAISNDPISAWRGQASKSRPGATASSNARNERLIVRPLAHSAW